MRKIQVIILLILLMALVACGSDGEPEKAVDSPPDQAAEALPTSTLPPPVIVSDSESDNQPTGDGSASEETAEEAPAEPPAKQPIHPWPADSFGYGAQSHAVVGDPNYAMDVLSNQLGLDWVKVQMEWPLVQPDPETFQWYHYDGAVNEANARGLNVMFSVVGSPEWTRAAGGHNGPPDDYAQYANFLTALLNQYPGKIHAIEVWNEQNIDREWSTPQGLSPANYVQFLSQANEAIKAVDPNVIVISGAGRVAGKHGLRWCAPQWL